MAFEFGGNLVLGERLRKELSKPFGIIIGSGQLHRSLKKGKRIYAIGDVTVATLLRHGYMPSVGIFDYRTERSRTVYPIIKKTYKKPLLARNRRGGLSRELWNAVRSASRSISPVGIRVTGEEDLASLACIHFARKGDIIIYGMRGRGMALIKIDKRIKKYVLNVLAKMSKAG